MIRLIDAEKIYDNGTHALNGVSFTVDDGEFAFLVGPSGSGKSTIIKLLTGEVLPTAGRVEARRAGRRKCCKNDYEVSGFHDCSCFLRSRRRSKPPMRPTK